MQVRKKSDQKISNCIHLRGVLTQCVYLSLIPDCILVLVLAVCVRIIPPEYQILINIIAVFCKMALYYCVTTIFRLLNTERETPMLYSRLDKRCILILYSTVPTFSSHQTLRSNVQSTNIFSINKRDKITTVVIVVHHRTNPCESKVVQQLCERRMLQGSGTWPMKKTRSSAVAERPRDRRFVSLNILLSHLRSLKIIRNDTVQQGVCKSLLVFD